MAMTVAFHALRSKIRWVFAYAKTAIYPGSKRAQFFHNVLRALLNCGSSEVPADAFSPYTSRPYLDESSKF